MSGSACVLSADAVPAADAVPRVRQRFVPADRPELWPDAGAVDWVPIRKSGLDRLLEQVRKSGSRRQDIPLSRAVYRAVFQPGSLSLTQGTATLTVSPGHSPGEVISCAPLNLSLREPAWEDSDAPAVLGAVPDGEHFLVIADDSRTLHFDWKLAGMQRLSGVEFLVRVPPAVASTLTLQLPDGWSLTASAGMVTRDRHDAEASAWRLELGRRTESRLRLIEPGQNTATEQNELTTASLNTRFELTPLVVNVAAEVSFESLAAQTARLDLQLAQAWQIRSVERVSGGSVAWQDLGPEDGLRRLRVEIPEGTTAADRGFVVNAWLPVPSGNALQLEAPRLSNAVLFDGRFQVTLGPPFTLQECSATGLSQTDVSVAQGNGGRTLLTFQQFAADARVRLSLRDDVSSRARLVSVREFSVGRFDRNPPEFHADLQVTARSREVFSIDAWVPRGWELTRVTHRIAAGLQEELPWRITQSQPDGPDRIRISLPDGVETGRPALLQISAQHVAWTRGTALALPALFPDINVLTSVTTGLVDASGQSAAGVRIEHFEPVDRSSVLPESAWSPVASGLADQPVSLHTLDYWEDAARFASLPVRRQGIVEVEPGPSDTGDGSEAASRSERSGNRDASQADPGRDVPGRDDGAGERSSDSQDAEPDSHPVRESSRSVPVVTGRLESFIAPGKGGRDLHRMSWRFAYSSAAQSLSLAFPKGAVLLETLWNDQPLAATADGDRWTVPVPQAVPGDTLTVSYTLKSKDVYLRDTCHVGLPEFHAISASFEWVLHLRKGFAAVSLSEEMTRLDSGRPAGWLRWFFGPLTRGSRTDWFNPLNRDDWIRLLPDPGVSSAVAGDAGPAGEALTGTGPAGSERIGPGQDSPATRQRNWNTIRSVSGVIPKSLSIHVCRVDRLNALAWFVLVATCLIGVTLRTCCAASRNRIGLVWLSGCLAAAMIVPDRYAELIGAAILGTVMATLLPRSLVRPQPKSHQDPSYPSMPSTIALPRGRVSELLLVLLAAGVAVSAVRVVAQESPVPLPDQIDVLVPYQGSRLDRRARRSKVVYLDARMLRRLQQTAAATAEAPAVLLTRSEWDGVIDRGFRSTVQGRLVLAVADTAGPVVDVPVPASLVDPESSVLLDGRPVPTLPGFDGRSLLIPNPLFSGTDEASEADSLTREELEKLPMLTGAGRTGTPPLPPPPLPETALPETAQMLESGPADGFGPETAVRWKLHTVEFQLRPEIHTDGVLRTFELPVSPSARSSFRLKFEVPPVSVRNSDRNAPVRVADDGTVTLQPGPVSQIALEWSTEATQTLPAEVTAEIRSAAEIHPGRILRQTLARLTPAEDASVSHIAWRLPRHLRLDRQQIRADRLVDVALQTRTDHTLVMLEFEPPHTKPFTMQMNWQQILSADSTPPTVQWEVPVSAERAPARLTVSSHYAGLNAAPGFTLAPQLLQLSEALRVENDAFLELWPENGRPRSPQIAIRIPERDRPAVPAGILPMQVQRTVRQNLQARIGPARIRWKVSAEIETSNAPAFLHELIIPEDVRIDSVSLQRDEVDRLSHWERRGDRLFLFLRDRSAGIQNVVIEGRQQFDRQQPIPVPDVRVAGSRLLASTLQVYSPPGLRPIVHGAEALEDAPDTDTRETSPLTAYTGEFRLSGDSQAVIELQAVREEFPLRWLGILDVTPDGQLEVELVIAVSTQMPRDWTVQLPDWAAGQVEILEIDGMENVSSSELLSAALDGRQLQLSVSAPGPEASELKLRLPVDPALVESLSPGQPLRLGPPVCRDAAQVPAAIAARHGTHRLAISGRQMSDLQREQLTALFDNPVDMTGALQWNGTSDVSIEPESASVLPAVVLHSVLSGGRVAQICRTRVLLNSDVRTLRILWPATIEEVYRRIDGQLRQTGGRNRSMDRQSAGSDPRIEIIELPSTGAVHHLELLWKPAPVSNRLKIRRETVEFPDVQLDTAVEQFVEVIPSAGVNVLPAQGRGRMETQRRILHERLAPWRTYAVSARVPLSRGVRRTLAAMLAAALADSPAGGIALAQSEQVSDDGAGADQSPVQNSSSGTQDSLLLRVPDDGDVTVWLIDRRLDLVLLGLVVGLAVMAPILKFFSLEFGERLAGRPMLSFVLIGLVWWLCLQGSAAGFVLLLLAALCWAVQALVPRLFRRTRRVPAA